MIKINIISKRRMHFLNLIQTDLCHPETVQLVSGPTLYCHTCQKGLFNVYEYITQQFDDHYLSSTLAQAYFAWTGDENVPMNFTLVELEGIYSKTISRQSLNRVKKSLRLLKALNAPFTTHPHVEYSQDMDTFLIDFLNIIHEHPRDNGESDHARLMLEALIKGIHNILSSNKEMQNPFQSYFETFVPFVQKCFTPWEPLKVKDSYSNLAIDLLIQLKISSAIRKTFGKFSIPFDVIHVMVSCFACSVDIDAVGNWVLDLMARVCRGHYFWKNYPECPFVVKMNQLVKAENKKRGDYHFLLKPIQEGVSADYYDKFLRPFYEMQMYFKRKFCTTDKVTETAFMQTFPAVCFQNHGDNLGFMMGYNYLIQTINSNNGRIVKGMFKKAKSVHLAVQKFVFKIQQFEEVAKPTETSPQLVLFWTMDTFKLFLASDKDYEKEILDTIKMLLSKDGEDDQNDHDTTME